MRADPKMAAEQLEAPSTCPSPSLVLRLNYRAINLIIRLCVRACVSEQVCRRVSVHVCKCVSVCPSLWALRSGKYGLSWKSGCYHSHPAWHFWLCRFVVQATLRNSLPWSWAPLEPWARQSPTKGTVNQLRIARSGERWPGWSWLQRTKKQSPNNRKHGISRKIVKWNWGTQFIRYRVQINGYKDVQGS